MTQKLSPEEKRRRKIIRESQKCKREALVTIAGIQASIEELRVETEWPLVNVFRKGEIAILEQMIKHIEGTMLELDNFIASL